MQFMKRCEPRMLGIFLQLATGESEKERKRGLSSHPAAKRPSGATLCAVLLCASVYAFMCAFVTDYAARRGLGCVLEGL